MPIATAVLASRADGRESIIDRSDEAVTAVSFHYNDMLVIPSFRWSEAPRTLFGTPGSAGRAGGCGKRWDFE